MNKRVVAKRTVKYLAVCKNPKVLREVLRTAPDEVVKIICNIALNALRGDVQLSASQRKLFKKHKATFITLCKQDKSISQKRKILVQKGGGFFIPALIGGLMSLLGGKLFGPKQEQQQ